MDKFEDILVKLYKGEELEYEEVPPDLEELSKMGLVRFNATSGKQLTHANLTETGVRTVLDKKRHKEQRNLTIVLAMITALYTAGTGGLIISNIAPNAQVLPLLGWVIIGSGLSAYFILAVNAGTGFPKILSSLKNLFKSISNHL